jgi:hypothetical protein
MYNDEMRFTLSKRILAISIPAIDCRIVHLLLLAIISSCIIRSIVAEEQPATAIQRKADAEWEAKQAKLPPEQRPFDIKGDRLGMSLAAFNRKYYRDRGRSRPPAPHSSADRPDKDNRMLFYKAEMAKVGIVAAAPIYPSEPYDSPPIKATIAGVETEAFIYKFIDGKLYEISVSFDQRRFQQVNQALKAKFGEPTGKDSEVIQNLIGANSGGNVIRWSNDVSSMLLCERAGDLTSLLLVTDKQLSAEAERRLTKMRASKD